MADTPYSDSKIALLRLYGILCWACIAAAWPHLKSRISTLKCPIILVLALLAWSMLSRFFALDPVASGDQRDIASMGPVGLAALSGLFLAVCLFLRTREQLQRLATAAIASSLPISLLALAEQHGFQNPEHTMTRGLQIASFLGSPLSVGSYLLMILPLSVWWLWLQMKDSGSRLSARVLLAATIVLVQFGAILAAEKRGPMLAAVVAGVIATILLQTHSRNLRRCIRPAILGLSIAAILTGLAFYKQMDPGIRDMPLVGKLSMIVPVGEGTGDAYRANLWKVAVDIFTRPDPILLPDGETDGSHWARPWLGFGPDNMMAALASGYIFLPGWPSEMLETSSHNHLLDMLLSLGLIGAAIFCGLYFTTFMRGLRALFAINTRPSRQLIVVGATTATLAAGMSLLWNPGYFAAGIQCGILAAFVLFAVLGHPRTQHPLEQESTSSSRLLVALLSATAGYWIYLCFMYPKAESLAVFFVFCGAIAGFATPTPRQNPSEDLRLPSVFWSCYLGSLTLYAVIEGRFAIMPVLTGAVPPYRLFTESAAITFLTFAILAASWAINAVLLNRDNCSKLEVRRTLSITGVAGVFLLLCFVLIAALARHTSLSLLADITSAQILTIPLVAAAFAAVAVKVAGVPGGARSSRVLMLFCAAAALFFLVHALGDLRAAVASGYRKRLQLPHDHALAEKVLRLAPSSMKYRLQQVRAIESKILKSPPYSADWLLLQDSRIRHLEEAAGHSLFSLATAKLGRAYIEKSEMTQNSNARLELLRKAASALDAAINFLPKNEPALVDRAFVHSALGEPEAARALLTQADTATDREQPGFFGINYFRWWAYYRHLAETTHNKSRRNLYARRSLRYLDLDIQQTDNPIESSPGPWLPRRQLLENKGWQLASRGEMWLLLGRPDLAKRDFALSGYFWGFKPSPETLTASLQHAHGWSPRK